MNEFICVFCESPMTAEQFICCDTYKGKMSLADYEYLDGNLETTFAILGLEG